MSSSTSKGRGTSIAVAVIFIVIAVLSIGIGRGIIPVYRWFIPTEATHIKGAISPSQEAFFEDPDTVDFYEEANIDLELEVLPVQEMVKLIGDGGDGYDFYVPDIAAASRALEMRDETTGSEQPDIQTTRVFSTPLIVLTHSELVGDMESHDLVKTVGGDKTFDLHKLVEMSRDGTRWRDISPSFGSPRVVDVAVPSVNESSAALEYSYLVREASLGLAAEELGTEDITKTSELARDTTRGLVVGQGHGETSADGILDTFLRVGKGEMPMVLATEQQYLSLLAEGHDMSEYTPLSLQPAGVLTHFVVSRTDKADAIAYSLESSALQQTAVHNGFRSKKPEDFNLFAEDVGYSVPMIHDEQKPPEWEQYDKLLQELQ